MGAVGDIFDLSALMEYTVEAGRPDTITPDKLKAIKDGGAGRISINPQTMNEKTLRLIGRAHTVEDIRRVYYQARETGHENINMDLILGLPEEGEAEVTKTMEDIAELAPEKSDGTYSGCQARVKAQRKSWGLRSYKGRAYGENDRHFFIRSKEYSLHPYYMYRQKNMLGSFENVGYAKKGFESFYNVVIMEETQTIFAAGAGASTKLCDPVSGRIDRIFNVKNVDEYIARIDEMIDRKRKGM